MRIPSLPFAPDDFLRTPDWPKFTLNAKAPFPERIAELHTIVRTGTHYNVDGAMGRAARECNCPDICLNFMAIEPTTGNSLLQTAIAAQRIDVLDSLRYFRPCSFAPFVRQLEILYSHQNYDGDTILHLAARTGRQDLVTAALQLYRNGRLDKPDERLESAAAAESNPTTWLTNEGEEGAMRVAEILFLLKQNTTGRTAADEARRLGHENIAAWLERALQLDDPKRERDDASCVQVWQDVYLSYYGLRSQKTDDTGKPVVDGSG